MKGLFLVLAILLMANPVAAESPWWFYGSVYGGRQIYRDYSANNGQLLALSQMGLSSDTTSLLQLRASENAYRSSYHRNQSALRLGVEKRQDQFSFHFGITGIEVQNHCVGNCTVTSDLLRQTLFANVPNNGQLRYFLGFLGAEAFDTDRKEGMHSSHLLMEAGVQHMFLPDSEYRPFVGADFGYGPCNSYEPSEGRCVTTMVRAHLGMEYKISEQTFVQTRVEYQHLFMQQTKFQYDHTKEFPSTGIAIAFGYRIPDSLAEFDWPHLGR